MEKYYIVTYKCHVGEKGFRCGHRHLTLMGVFRCLNKLKQKQLYFKEKRLFKEDLFIIAVENCNYRKLNDNETIILNGFEYGN